MRKEIETTIETKEGSKKIKFLSESSIEDIFELMVFSYVGKLASSLEDNFIAKREIKDKYIKIGTK
jgi:hypothetical protein